jgi:hypothetical protein
MALAVRLLPAGKLELEVFTATGQVRFNQKIRPTMQEHLGRCAEQLRYAVRYLANGSCPPREKLTGMYSDAGLEAIARMIFRTAL